MALKIQYAGVADSIDSDIAILGTLLAPLAPRGLFLSTALAELRVAMKDETDYRAEAAQTERMRGLLEGDGSFRVPRVAWELCADRVIATELLQGIPLDR